MKKNKDAKDERRKKIKKRKIFRKLLLLLFIIVLIAVGRFIYKSQKNGGGLSGMLATAVGHDENTKKDLKEIKVLLMGVSTDLDSELTDTIMVASYNPNTQKANLLSIPRDTFIGKNQSTATPSQKINCLYNMTRNPQKTLDAVNEITGLDIEYYVLVRTEALIKLVDAIGGVEFNVPINMYYTDKSQNLVIDLDEGLQLLNGDKAEQLLRFRHNNDGTSYPAEYGDNDLGRMRTQREFIMATLKQTLKPGNIFKIGEILDIAIENVETNLELSYIKDYIPYAVEFSTENMITATLPGTTPDMKDTNNVSIFVANKSKTTELIQSMFYSETQEEDETNTELNNNTVNNTIQANTEVSNIKIELLNGSGSKNNLEKAKKLLEDAGYIVKKTGTTTAISKTVITNKKSLKNEELNKIKEILGVGSISTVQNISSSVDVSIIIGKDFQ